AGDTGRRARRRSSTPHPYVCTEFSIPRLKASHPVPNPKRVGNGVRTAVARSFINPPPLSPPHVGGGSAGTLRLYRVQYRASEGAVVGMGSGAGARPPAASWGRAPPAWPWRSPQRTPASTTR